MVPNYQDPSLEIEEAEIVNLSYSEPVMDQADTCALSQNEISDISDLTLEQLRDKVDSLPVGMKKRLISMFNKIANKKAHDKNVKDKRRTANKIAKESRKKNRK